MVWRRAARLGPWDKPLNFDLHVTPAGEPRTPFALYVQPKSDFKPYMGCTTFLQFCLLPVELQRHILFFCDAPTLFQLMQSSSSTRHEAKKLFWSNPDTWYRINGYWLHHGGYAGKTFEDLSILIHVRRVNICFHYLSPRNWTQSKHRNEMDKVPHVNDNEYTLKATDEVLQGIEDEIRQFWRSLQNLCPRLTHVVISTKARERDRWNTPPTFHGKFLRLSPAGINASTSLGQRPSYRDHPDARFRMERSLWVLHNNKTNPKGVADQWEKVLTGWTPQTIFLPPKKFQGPVGAFTRMSYRSHRRTMWEHGTELLRIDAMERHHFHQKHEPFVCFAPGCGVWFNAPGEYLVHSIRTRHDQSMVLPEDLKALFDKHSEKLRHLYGQDHWEPYDQDTGIYDLSSERFERAVNLEEFDEDQVMISQMEEEVLHYVTVFEKKLLLDRRVDAERAFLHQLQHDPLYATGVPAVESRLWSSFQESLLC